MTRYTGSYGVLPVAGYPLLSWAFSTEYGVWWVGCGRGRFQIKAPWNEPLFSERYGHARFIRLGGGWRCRFFTVPEP